MERVPWGFVLIAMVARGLCFFDGDRVHRVALLDGVDDVLTGLVADLAEDGVFAVEPVGDDVGDEEL